MNKKLKYTILIIASLMGFLFVYFVFFSVVSIMVSDVPANIVSILAGLVGAYYMYKYFKNYFDKKEQLENNKKLRYITQTKNCEFCMSELINKRDSMSIKDECQNDDYLLKEYYICPKCQYVLVNNTLYRKQKNGKPYKYCEVKDYGNIEKSKIDRGMLLQALNILDCIDNEKNKK